MIQRLNWKLVQITEVLDNKIVFKDFKNEFGGQILKDQFKWAIKKKVQDRFKIGDVIFVKKNSNNSWSLKQYLK